MPTRKTDSVLCASIRKNCQIPGKFADARLEAVIKVLVPGNVHLTGTLQLTFYVWHISILGIFVNGFGRQGVEKVDVVVHVADTCTCPITSAWCIKARI